MVDPVLLRLCRTRYHLPQPEQQNNLLNAAMKGRMVPSGIAHRSSGRTQSWKYLSSARTDHGLATVALRLCVLLAETRSCEQMQLGNKSCWDGEGQQLEKCNVKQKKW